MLLPPMEGRSLAASDSPSADEQSINGLLFQGPLGHSEEALSVNPSGAIICFV